MSSIILPGRPGWFGMVSPREEEMPAFLKLVGQGWRTPKRTWEDLWRLRRGELNHMLGTRSFGPKYQRGSIGTFMATNFPVAAGGTSPNLQDVTHDHTSSAPTQSRIQLAYDSDGSLRFDEGTTVASIAYAELTTQSDDANDHTNDWWPDQPDTNEGLNWDIDYSVTSTSGSGSAHYFKDTVGPTNRTASTWYLLDTVSNDHADGTNGGCMGCHRTNGTAKSPTTGTYNQVTLVGIRATGSGSAVASHTVDLTVNGT